MDFGAREVFTVIIVLLIIGILLDGMRRMRQSRRSTIRMSSNFRKRNTQSPPDEEELDQYGSELPNGGARVSTRCEEDAEQANKNIKENYEASRPKIKKTNKIPQQVSLNLEESVPMLMESVDLGDKSHPVGDLLAADADGTRGPDAGLKQEDERLGQDFTRIEPTFSEQSIEDIEEEADAPGGGMASSTKTTGLKARSEAFPETSHEIRNGEPRHTEPQHTEPQHAEPEEVLVINVMAAKGELFPGQTLLEVLLEKGMRFGAMNIFHRHRSVNGEGPVLFSLANIVVPGTFDLNKMEVFQTPGVSMFMTLPMERAESGKNHSSLTAFDLMVDTAKELCKRLGGELKDEQRSVMTTQTIEHFRQRIREFERRQLSRTPA